MKRGGTGTGRPGETRETPYRVCFRAPRLTRAPPRRMSDARPMSRALVVAILLVLVCGCDGGAAPPASRPKAAPVADGKLGRARRVAVARSHVCAVLASGRVACWGKPDDLKETAYATTPQLVANLPDAVEVAGRCARRKIGSIACWNRGLAAVDIPGTEGARGLVNSDLGLVCFVTATRTAACLPPEGQTAITPIEGLVDLRALGSKRGEFWCGVRTSGQVACAGELAKLGLATGRGVATVPSIDDAVDVVTLGLDLACAITRTGALACFGDGLADPAQEQLPRRAHQLYSRECLRDGARVACFDPHRSAWLPWTLAGAATDLSCDSRTCCAVLADGAIQCWGSHEHGRLGDGVDVERKGVAKVDHLPAIASLEAGSGVTFARSRNNELYAWGLVGSGPRMAAQIASNVTALAVIGGFALVAHGRDVELLTPDDHGWRHHELPALPADLVSLAFDGRDGPRYCAALADGTTVCSAGDAWDGTVTWQPIAGLRDIAQLSALNDTCGVTRAGTVACFVRPDDYTPATKAAIVPGVEKARRVSLPYIELTDGSVVRLDNDHGRLAVVPRPALTGISNISFGGHWWSVTCGVKDAQPVCWADDRDYSDSHGTLGRDPDTQIDKATPAPARIGVATTSVSAGYTHVCALDPAGGVWCWGDDRNGELGRGRIVEQPPPVRVVGIGP